MLFRGIETVDSPAASPIGVLLTNVGSPAAPTTGALRRYLAQFLGDPRLIEYPRWWWLPLLHGVILNTRPRRSAALYRHIWTEEGSPLLVTMRRQAEALQSALQGMLTVPIKVAIGARYGEPSIAAGLRQLDEAGARRILVFPLYPQYSATTTATSFDAVFDELKTWRRLPELRTINHYHDHPGYVAALAASVREHWATSGRPDRLLISYHGIPQEYALKGDPYDWHCRETTRLLAEALGLEDDDFTMTFQSRFGPSEWLQPYTDETLEAWGREGVAHVDALCPGFSADCLETTDEVAREGGELFREAGGGELHYIPALNDRPDHIAALADVVIANLGGWLEPDAPRALAKTELARSAFGMWAGRDDIDDE
jgi:ferrochelatase